MLKIAVGFLEVAMVVAVVAGKILINFFKDMVIWIQNNVIPVIKDLLGKAFELLKTFVKKIEPTLKHIEEVVVGYAKEATAFIKKTVSRVVTVGSELPDEIKKRLQKASQEDEVDVSDVLELQLS